MKKYNISANLIRVIKNFYDKATTAVLFNSSIGDWFRTTAGVRQGCLLLTTLFNIFLEKIMTNNENDNEGHRGKRDRKRGLDVGLRSRTQKSISSFRYLSTQKVNCEKDNLAFDFSRQPNLAVDLATSCELSR